jgi:hypothetical protein
LWFAAPRATAATINSVADHGVTTAITPGSAHVRDFS